MESSQGGLVSQGVLSSPFQAVLQQSVDGWGEVYLKTKPNLPVQHLETNSCAKNVRQLRMDSLRYILPPTFSERPQTTWKYTLVSPFWHFHSEHQISTPELKF